MPEIPTEKPPYAQRRSIDRSLLAGLTCLQLLLQSGCGPSAGKVPGPIKNIDEIAALLPQGINLDTPVIPDARYGFSKTVAEALHSLQATLDGKTIRDGQAGQEIRFEHGKPATSGKSPKKKPAAKSPYTVIMLAN